MGYRIIEYCGEKYKLTPKWYKQYLTALELMRKVKETNTDELDISGLVDIREDAPLHTTLTPFDRFCWAINSVVERYTNIMKNSLRIREKCSTINNNKLIV